MTRGGDGLKCIAMCRPGYTGNRCEYCKDMFYASNGSNGSIDLSNQKGPICKGRSIITSNQFWIFKWYSYISVCRNKHGACNVFGSKACTKCGSVCKVGYEGNICQTCQKGFYASNGIINGEVNSITGIGAKCEGASLMNYKIK